MKKIVLHIPAISNANYSFLISDALFFAKRWTKLFTLMTILAYALYFIIIFLLPFLPLVSETHSEETSLFLSFGILIICISTLLAIVVSQSHRKLLHEPPGLFYVLLFAFLSTLTAFLVKNQSFNSFGDNDVRVISGLSMIYFLVFYYITNVVITSTRAVRTSINTLQASVFLLSLYFLFIDASYYYHLVPMFLMLPFFAVKVFANNRSFYSFGLLFLCLAFITFKNDGVSDEYWIAVLSSACISSLLIFLILVIKCPTIFRERARMIKYSFFKLKSALKKKDAESSNAFFIFMNHIFKSLALFTPFLLFLLIVLFHTDDTWQRNVYEVAYTQIETSWNTIHDEGFTSSLIGIGAGDKNDIQGNLSSETSLIANVLLAQGIVGVIAYAILFIFGIFSAISLYSKYIESRKSSELVSMPLLFTLFFIPVLSIFLYANFLVMAVWWLSLSLVCVHHHIHNTTINTNFLNSTTITIKTTDTVQRFPKTIQKYFPFLSILCILLIGLLLLYAFLKIKDSILV